VNNEVIGIGGVFVLTLFLFLLRHVYLSIGQHGKSRHITPAAPLANNKSDRDSGADDAWLLWSAEPDQTDSTNRSHNESAEHRGRAERKESFPPQ
jgi:hypothetical protein